MYRQRESSIERRFVEYVEDEGGVAIKITKRIGYPDRLVLLPEGRKFFIEFKRPGEKPRKIQLHVHKELERLGHGVYVCDNYEEALEIYEKEKAGW